MSIELDRIDLKILKALQSNARLTNLALSEQVALSPSACLARVQKLRDGGFISADLALVDTAKLGPVLHSFLEITLSSHNLEDHRKFEKGIRAIPEIVMAVKVSGRFDYLLALVTRDMPALNQLSDKLLEGSLGIAKLVTIPVLDVPKKFSGFPLDNLL